MAINFLIAVATALFSATLILLILRLFLKAFAPNAFKEMIPVSRPPIESPVSGSMRNVAIPIRHLTLDHASWAQGTQVAQGIPASVPLQEIVLDSATSSALPVSQFASLMREYQVLYRSTYSIQEPSTQSGWIQTRPTGPNTLGPMRTFGTGEQNQEPQFSEQQPQRTSHEN